jgi:large subunit ribosomal protein L32
MAVPKRRTSKSKVRKRRTHQKTLAPNVSTCSQCGAAKEMHRACTECGTYKGRTVIEMDND